MPKYYSCSLRALEFNSLHIHQAGYKHLVSPAQGDLISSSSLHGHFYTHGIYLHRHYVYMHIEIQLIYIHMYVCVCVCVYFTCSTAHIKWQVEQIISSISSHSLSYKGSFAIVDSSGLLILITFLLCLCSLGCFLSLFCIA